MLRLVEKPEISQSSPPLTNEDTYLYKEVVNNNIYFILGIERFRQKC
jgi:hypothetical protein